MEISMRNLTWFLNIILLRCFKLNFTPPSKVIGDHVSLETMLQQNWSVKY